MSARARRQRADAPLPPPPPRANLAPVGRRLTAAEERFVRWLVRASIRKIREERGR